MAEQRDSLTGGCACGAVRYIMDQPPISVNNCYCTLCQRQTGSTSVVNMFIEAESLHVEGETTRHVVAAGSGADHAIIRCATCGTALWSEYGALGEFGPAVRAGTLDDPAGIRPDAAIYVDSRMDWVCLPDGIPSFEGFYSPKEVLPPERYARLKSVVAKMQEAKAQ